MHSTSDILAALKQHGITHERIAAVLGVTTPNATKLFNPAGKTGKPRKISYDEGVRLIEAFDLAEPAHELGPLSEPVARLVVLHVAHGLGVKAPEPLVDELARDIAAFSEFATEPQVRESADQAMGFLRALRGRHSPTRATR